MLMLENFKKRMNLLENLEVLLDSYQYACVVSDNKKLLKTNLNKDEIKGYISLFKSSDIYLGGVSHGMIIGPLFALSFEKNQYLASLKKYLVASDDLNALTQKRIQNDLTMLAIAVSFFYPQVTTIRVPLFIEEFKNDECEVVLLSNECMINIKHRAIS